MSTSSPTPHDEAVQIELIPVEDIEPVVGLRRSRRPLAHASDCGIGDGMYFIYTSHLQFSTYTVHLIEYVNLIMLLCLMKQVRLDL